jgi:hypothetical protein
LQSQLLLFATAASTVPEERGRENAKTLHIRTESEAEMVANDL